MLAVSGNSPVFLGRRLWEETRIALFEEAADDRDEERRWRGQRPGALRPRLGARGRRRSCSRWSVRDFEPLLPVLDEEDPLEVVRRGGVPRLAELRLHQSTVWQWNRPVYDPADGGHLRVEMRALPAGPTVRGHGGQRRVPPRPRRRARPGAAGGLPVLRGVPELLPRGEGRARGLAALARPGGRAAAAVLVRALLPVARAGLDRLRVASGDVDAALEVIGARATTGRTGSRWLREAIAAADDDPEGWARVVRRYRELALTHRPVHTWPPLTP